MILYELMGNNESNPVYQTLQNENYFRQHSFLRSVVYASLNSKRPFLSQTIIKAMNYHAITCLHSSAGEYRPCSVNVGGFSPPEHYRVNDLMDDFVNSVNRHWETSQPIWLSAHVLWKLNWIHPFINGNGRTARAACYFVLCVKAGGLIGGSTLLPELLRIHKSRYVKALKRADNGDLLPLCNLIIELLDEQKHAAPNA